MNPVPRPLWLRPYGDGDNFHEVLKDQAGNACVIYPCDTPGHVVVDATMTPAMLRELADWVEGLCHVE